MDNIWNAINFNSKSCSFITIGGGGGAKNVCFLPSGRSIVVSIGSTHDYAFELTALNYTHHVYIVNCKINNAVPAPLTHVKQCVGSQYRYMYSSMLADTGVYRIDIMKLSIGTHVWDIINDIVLHPQSPNVLLIDVHFSPAMDCGEYIKAQAWAAVLRNKYVLMNWRRNIHGCPNCIETTYHKIRNVDYFQPRHCFSFAIMNEGLGGSMLQIMLGMVTAFEANVPFCLSNSLVDPQPQHMHDYSWILKYINISLCSDIVGHCEVSKAWYHELWEQKTVIGRWKSYFKSEYTDALHRIQVSPLNANYPYCVHVRTGDYTSIPDITWEGRSILIFGGNSDLHLPACGVNNCTYVDTSSVEFDFINLANCDNIVYSISTFSILTNIFSPKHNATAHPHVKDRTNPDFFS